MTDYPVRNVCIHEHLGRHGVHVVKLESDSMAGAVELLDRIRVMFARGYRSLDVVLGPRPLEQMTCGKYLLSEIGFKRWDTRRFSYHDVWNVGYECVERRPGKLEMVSRQPEMKFGLEIDANMLDNSGTVAWVFAGAAVVILGTCLALFRY